MPKLFLYLHCLLDGISSLSFPEDTLYCFQVQCTSCRETHPNPMSMSLTDEVDIPGGRGSANFVYRCRNCDRDASISISDPLVFKGGKGKMLSIECRGCETIDYYPAVLDAQGDGKRKTKFEGIEVDMNEWFDYDPDGKKEVSIQEMEWTISRT